MDSRLRMSEMTKGEYRRECLPPTVVIGGQRGSTGGMGAGGRPEGLPLLATLLHRFYAAESRGNNHHQNAYPNLRPNDVKSPPNVEVKPKRTSSVRKSSSSHDDPRVRATS